MLLVSLPRWVYGPADWGEGKIKVKVDEPSLTVPIHRVLSIDEPAPWSPSPLGHAVAISFVPTLRDNLGLADVFQEKSTRDRNGKMHTLASSVKYPCIRGAPSL